MRIGLVRYKYDAAGGAERTLGLLALGLLARGHQVAALVTAWQGEKPQGLEVLACPSAAGGAKWTRGSRLARAVAPALAAWGADTWLSLERVPGCPILRAGDGCHAAWLERRAALSGPLRRLSFRLNPFHRATLDLERRTLQHAGLRAVIANSRLVADELTAYYQVPPKKIRLLYNPVDQAALAQAVTGGSRDRVRQDLGLETGQRVMLFLGGGWQRKGLAFALAALAHLPGVLLLVAGKDRPGPYQARAQALGVSDRVRFLGQVDQAYDLLAACDLLILPTIYDPCANSCLEALALGVPVVTTRANGASELVEPGKSGQVVDDPRDAPALASACGQSLGLRGPFAPQTPSQEAWLDSIEALLRETRP